MKSVVIVGAGISGLSIGYLLKNEVRRSGKDVEIRILESSDRVGGNIGTIQEDGYLIERGPTGFLSKVPETLRLCKSLGILNRVVVSSDTSRYRYIYKDNMLHPLPTGPVSLFSSKIITWQIIKPFLREFRIHPGNAELEETVAGFFSRRLSREIVDDLVDPFISGVYAGDPDNLSIKSVFPKLYKWEQQYGSFIKGALKSREKKERFYDDEFPKLKRTKLLSFIGGMKDFIDALESALKNEIYKNTEARRLSCHPGSIPRYRIEARTKSGIKEYPADAVILSLPAYTAAELVTPLSEKLASVLRGIPYAPIMVVGMGFRDLSHPLKGYGFLVPHSQKKQLLGCQWNSSIFLYRAPKNGAVLTCMLGGACNPDVVNLSDDQLLSVSMKELGEIMNIPKSNVPAVVRIIRYASGIPQYNIGHEERKFIIKQNQKDHPGLFCFGTYLDGIAVNDAAENAYNILPDILHFLFHKK